MLFTRCLYKGVISNQKKEMKYCLLIILLIQIQIGFSQEMQMKSIEDLINKEEPAWELVEEWIKEAKNEIEVLEKDSTQADSA